MSTRHPFDDILQWQLNYDPNVTYPSGTLQVNGTWTPPPWQELNFTASDERCDAATKYTSMLAKGIASLQRFADAPPEYAVNYTWTLLPDRAKTDNVTIQKLLTWVYSYEYWAQEEGQPATEMLKLPIQRCGKLMCENLDWAGDSDLTGVGMMISYYLVILLLTAYFINLLIARLPAVKRRARKHKWVRRYLQSYTESTGTFLDSALVFAIAMLAAAITRYASYMRNPDKSQTVYALFGSAFMSTFSIFPPIVLQCIHSGLRKHHVRQFMWLVVIALTITVQVFYRRVYKDRSWGTTPEDWEWTGLRANTQFAEFIWLRMCDPRSKRVQLENILTGAHWVLLVNACVWVLMWTMYLVFMLGFSQKMRDSLRARRDEAKWWKYMSLVKKVIMTFNALFGLMMAWCLLGYFHGYRSKVSEIAAESNADLNWTFGQVLALATWAPVLVDNTTIYIYGSTNGLTSGLPKGYKAVREDGRDSEASSLRKNSEKSGDSGLPFVGNQTPRPSGQHHHDHGGYGDLNPQPYHGHYTQSESEGSTMR